MGVVSVRVDRELREKMLRYRGRVDWAEEIRRFIKERVRQMEAEEEFEEILRGLKAASWGVPRGFSAGSVREDRDSG